MISRILLILKTQNLSSSQFADEIGVQRSSISHILSGRNNPSLEFVMKILKRFPDINSDWLIFGKGSMYKGSNAKIDEEVKELQKIAVQPDLFNFNINEQLEIQPIKSDELSDDKKYDNLIDIKMHEKDNISPEIQQINTVITPNEKEVKTEQINKFDETNADLIKSQKTIDKIFIFYSDRTFREYLPE